MESKLAFLAIHGQFIFEVFEEGVEHFSLTQTQQLGVGRAFFGVTLGQVTNRQSLLNQYGQSKASFATKSCRCRWERKKPNYALSSQQRSVEPKMSVASPSRVSPFASWTSSAQQQREDEERTRLAASRAAFIAPSSGQDEGIVNVPTARLSARSQTLDVCPSARNQKVTDLSTNRKW
jgi:hypothetical protein